MDKASWVFKQIKIRATTASFIKGIYHVESLADTIDDPAVELKMFIVLEPNHEEQHLIELLKTALAEKLGVILLIPEEGISKKIVLYLDGYPRIDIKFGTDTPLEHELAGILRPLYIKDSKTRRQQDMQGSMPNHSVPCGFIHEHVSKILHDFELHAIAHFHSDYLGFYAIHYPMLLDTLHLQGVVAGKRLAASSTKHLLNSVMVEGEQQYFVRNFLNTSFGNANEIREYFMDWLFSIIEDIQAKFGNDALPAPAGAIQDFCTRVHDTYYLRNFRNVQGTRKIFRSVAPAAYKGSVRLEKWFIDHDIKALVDLRRPDEVEKDPDDALLAEKLGQTIHQLNFNADEVNANDYVKGLVGCKDTIKAIFRVFLNTQGSTLIHCGAGKDRTGIVAGLVELLLGVPEDTIVAAYLLSGQDTREERIVNSLTYIKQNGGITKFLESCGISGKEQQLIIKKLHDSSSR
nr:tyrosine-protein phosphatase [Candidatus Sigynarchaeota archaeon]